jgi:hypothetical protein
VSVSAADAALFETGCQIRSDELVHHIRVAGIPVEKEEHDCSFGLPVLKTWPGHPEAGALWEKIIITILDELDIMYTTH